MPYMRGSEVEIFMSK